VYVINRETGVPIRRSDPFSTHINVFTPPTPLGSRQQGAAAFGGSEWSPTAYSPRTGYLYVLGSEDPLIYKLRHEERVPGAWWVGGAYYAVRANNQGSVSAVDLNTGRIAWQRGMPKPMVGGALATATDLVFVGSSDQHVMAFDARTGRTLWSFLTNGGVNAPPMTYVVNGRQYIAVAAGGNWVFDTPRSDELLVFTLGVPQAGEPGAKPPSPPKSTRH
jgi:outer membrane protein assembly factor BamB